MLLLDCCFSGSFPAGVRHRAGDDMDAPGQLQGRGRAIITASNAMEYAYEGDELTGEGRPSFFTEAVVEGLRTGKADLDMDHLVSIDDLYHYVYDRVRERTPHQTPSIKSDVEGVLYLARSSYRAPVGSGKLDPELSRGPRTASREFARAPSRSSPSLLSSSDESVAMAAREILLMMTASDDSRRVAPPRRPYSRRPKTPEPPPPAVEPPAAEPGAGSRSQSRSALALAAVALVVARDRAERRVGRGRIQRPVTTAVTDEAKIPAGNLVKNPSFEQSTDAWDTSGGGAERRGPAVARTSGGRAGWEPCGPGQATNGRRRMGDRRLGDTVLGLGRRPSLHRRGLGQGHRRHGRQAGVPRYTRERPPAG